jgi:hypothetical protein
MAEIIASDARRKNRWLPLASLLNWVGKGIYSDTTPAPERIEPAKKATTLLLINAAA